MILTVLTRQTTKQLDGEMSFKRR